MNLLFCFEVLDLGWCFSVNYVIYLLILPPLEIIQKSIFQIIPNFQKILLKFVTCMSLSTGGDILSAVFCFLCDKG